MAHTVTLYVDYMSQPSRACVIFCRMHQLPVDVRQVRLSLGEHRQPAYLKLNPLGKVPLLVDGDLHLPESSAILLYLCRKFSNLIPSYWYPTTDPHRALADSALHWQHTTVRLGSMKLVFNRVLAPKLGRKLNPAVAADGHQVLTLALSQLEQYWLKDTPFMLASHIGLADLLCVCELQQLHLLVGSREGPHYDELLSSYPGVRRWVARVTTLTNPFFDQAHEVLMKATRSFQKALQAQQAPGSKL